MFSQLARHVARSRPSLQFQQLRFLNVHEYQGAELMSKFGVNTPPGKPVFSLEEVGPVVDELADSEGEVVIKSQVLAGGRGLGKFTNGLQGGVHIVHKEEAKKLAKQMLGGTLVTKQTGPAGKPVNTLYVAAKLKLANEMYFAILLDRATAGVLLIGCSEGGTSIEDLAEKYPEKIVRIPVDIREGITDAQAAEMVRGLQVKGDAKAAAEQIKGLYNTFTKCDCTMVEVNPLAETEDGKLIAADAKLGFDDNAAFRQKEIFAMRDASQEDPRKVAAAKYDLKHFGLDAGMSLIKDLWLSADPFFLHFTPRREVAAAKFDLNYIGLDGEIGCMVNGAGLAMATMDIIKLHGGTPANFLDVGGNASEEQVVQAFKILTSDKQVKAILVNIFGGIMKCDVIASGIVNAAKGVGMQVPLIVRLEGTNVERGKEILKTSGLDIIAASDLDDAAHRAVQSLAK